MTPTFANPFFEVEYQPKRLTALIRRTAMPFGTIEELTRSHAEIEAELRRRGIERLLIDVRDGPPGRNDPAFEDGGRTARQTLTRGAKQVIFLVGTAAGMLHARRLAKQDGIACEVCSEEAEALRLLARD